MSPEIVHFRQALVLGPVLTIIVDCTQCEPAPMRTGMFDWFHGLYVSQCLSGTGVEYWPSIASDVY